MGLHANPESPPLRLFVTVLALGSFYWGLFGMPIPSQSGGGLDPEKARELQDESAVMRRYGNWRRALPLTLRLHEAYPENPIYIGQAAEAYDHLGRYREEAGMWEEFLQRAPRPIEGCPQIGEAYDKQGLPKEAIEAYQKCVAIDPMDPDQVFYLARELEKDGQIDRAATFYARGVELSPNYTDLAAGLARMRVRQGKFEEALKLATGILTQSPRNADALLVLGLACERLGRRAEAKSYFERGVQAADGYADLHLALAKLAEQDADLNTAILHYGRVVELDRTNAEAAHRLALLKKVRE
jgi:tetratricopeptide (TPR) repeat protein